MDDDSCDSANGRSQPDTSKDQKSIAALGADIQTWETEIRFFDTVVQEISNLGGNAMSGNKSARGLRKRIAEWRALIESVRRLGPLIVPRLREIVLLSGGAAKIGPDG